MTQPDFETAPFTVIVDTREQTPWLFKSVMVRQSTVLTKKMLDELPPGDILSAQVGDRIELKRPLVVKTKAKGLKTGDYSFFGPIRPGEQIEWWDDNDFCLERKSLPDALSTFTDGRQRFEHELSRMAEFNFAAVVLEFSHYQMMHKIPDDRKVKPQTLDESIRAWRQRYGVHFLFNENRAFAELNALREMRRFWNDQREKKEQWKWQIAWY